ncbi:MAG: hypothetical protein ACPG32_14760 [Akkermansiaceae bacterium]
MESIPITTDELGRIRLNPKHKEALLDAYEQSSMSGLVFLTGWLGVLFLVGLGVHEGDTAAVNGFRGVPMPELFTADSGCLRNPNNILT